MPGDMLRIATPLCIVLALLQTSCNVREDDLGSRTQPRETTGYTLPNPWLSITEVVSFCDYPVCSGGDGFTVLSDGSYQIGNGAQGSGVLTPSELASLAAVANPVAIQSGPEWSCSPIIQLAGASRYELTMSYRDQTSRQIISLDTRNLCNFGNRRFNEALHEELHGLELKYDPRSLPSTTIPTAVPE